MGGLVEGTKYICEIGVPSKHHNQSTQFEVGIYDGGQFTFSNGPYARTGLYHQFSERIPEHYSNATRVLAAKPVSREGME